MTRAQRRRNDAIKKTALNQRATTHKEAEPQTPQPGDESRLPVNTTGQQPATTNEAQHGNLL